LHATPPKHATTDERFENAPVFVVIVFVLGAACCGFDVL